MNSFGPALSPSSLASPSHHHSDSSFCASSFPSLWSSFLAVLTDTALAEGPVAARPFHSSSHALTSPETTSPPIPPTRLPKAERLVAIGDLHGDLGKARQAFRLAGLINEKDRWIGGTATCVQVGDILDRGDEELQIWFFLERLKREAEGAGGALHILNGNHETMNVSGQFRYATPGGFEAFRQWGILMAQETALAARCGACAPRMSPSEVRKVLSLRHADGKTARTSALVPGSGPLAMRFISPNPAVLQIGSTVFCHGGLLPEHVYNIGIERINSDTHAWLLHGTQDSKPQFLSGRDAVVWTRHYSVEDQSRCDCERLEHALKGLPGAMRMVVGHTIQQAGINAACDGRVIRVDVGLSQGCGDGQPEVLEILRDGHVHILRQHENILTSRKQNLKEEHAKESRRTPLGLDMRVT